MSKRYDQYCPVAHALGLVGERWSLLIVRELLQGPKRYTDLAASLPGIGTNILAARLKELETCGLVTKHRLDPPAAEAGDDLTERLFLQSAVSLELPEGQAPALARRSQRDDLGEAQRPRGRGGVRLGLGRPRLSFVERPRDPVVAARGSIGTPILSVARLAPQR